MDFQSVMSNYVMPFLTGTVALIFGVAICGGLAYYLFIIRRRKKWKCNIWELKSNKKLYLMETDTLVAKKFNKGKQTAYILRRNKCETLPPPDQCIDKIGKQEIANYLRVLEDYIPLERSIDLPDDFYESEYDAKKQRNVNKFTRMIKESILGLKKLSTSEVESRYVYAPISKSISPELRFTPIDYDINMMRINALDNRDKIYQDAQSFLDKYGHLIAIGFVVVLVIVTLYFSYDYSATVIDKITGKIDGLVKPLDIIAGKLGGTTPPG